MEIKLDKIDSYEFSAFIKKLLSIDKFIFMKVGQEYTQSSVYLPQRDAVKLVNVKTEELFGQKIDTPLKISFYNGSKVNDALSHFSDEVQGRIIYNESDNENMASDFIIEGQDLTINLACADPSLSFMEMTKDEIQRAFNTDNKMFEFDLLTTHVDRIKSLFNLEKEEEVFDIYISDKGVSVRGKSFDTLISSAYEGNVDVGTKVSVYKKFINLLDKENYKLIVCDNKLVFKSLDTQTMLIIAVAMIDEDE